MTLHVCDFYPAASICLDVGSFQPVDWHGYVLQSADANSHCGELYVPPIMFCELKFFVLHILIL